jgi:hypothetical protein
LDDKLDEVRRGVPCRRACDTANKPNPSAHINRIHSAISLHDRPYSRPAFLCDGPCFVKQFQHANPANVKYTMTIQASARRNVLRVAQHMFHAIQAVRIKSRISEAA